MALRYFFVYGPGQYKGTGYKSVIYKNFERLINDKDPIVFGDGRQTLDYIYIDDVIKATIKSASLSVSEEVINIGTSVPTNINQLTAEMVKITQKKCQIKYKDPDDTHDTYRVADTKKASSVLGTQQTTNLSDGLKKTYSWIINQQKYAS